MNSIRKNLTIFTVVLVVTGGTLFVVQSLINSRALPEFATVWPSPMPLKEFSLVDHTGQEFTKSRLQGKWSVMFFGFTNCPDICPATLQQLAIVNKNLQELGKSAPDIILVSVDPERDTPAVLATYVGHFGGDILGVTGSTAELTQLTSSAGIFFEKSELPNGDYSIDHSSAVIVINKDAAIHASFSAPHSIDSLVNDLPILMRTD